MSLVLDPAALLPDCVLNQYKSHPEFAVTILNAIKQKEIHFFLLGKSNGFGNQTKQRKQSCK